MVIRRTAMAAVSAAVKVLLISGAGVINFSAPRFNRLAVLSAQLLPKKKEIKKADAM